MPLSRARVQIAARPQMQRSRPNYRPGFVTTISSQLLPRFHYNDLVPIIPQVSLQRYRPKYRPGFITTILSQLSPRFHYNDLVSIISQVSLQRSRPNYRPGFITKISSKLSSRFKIARGIKVGSSGLATKHRSGAKCLRRNSKEHGFTHGKNRN